MGTHGTFAAKTLHSVGTQPLGKPEYRLRISVVLSHHNVLDAAQRRRWLRLTTEALILVGKGPN
jgi:hypothetical protein